MRRPRINRLVVDESTQAQRIIRLLSEIYEIGYNVVRVYYYRYNQKVNVVKLHLNRIYQIGNELSIIN
jgi:hypothetical protein